MIENASQIIINNIEPVSWKLELIRTGITTLGTFIAVAGSLWVFTRQEKESIKKKHFERIKLELLDEWGRNIENDPELLNKSLFHDLINHFPHLVKLERNVRDSEKIKEDIINNFIDSFNRKYNLKKIYPHFHHYFLNSRDEYFKPKIENDSLRCEGFVIAEGDEVTLSQLKKELEHLLKSKEVINLRKAHEDILKNKDLLQKEIKTVRNKEKLPGECQFIK